MKTRLFTISIANATQERESMKSKTLMLSAVLALLVVAIPALAQTEQPGVTNFATLINFDNTNGGNPGSPLIQGKDGNFYGTTSQGGRYTSGTFFKVSSQGKLTTLYSFCSETNCADGALPTGPLVLGVDGNFYGITEGGGANSSGTVFKITPGGTLTTIYNWCSQVNCADGAYGDWPEPGAIVQATDGNFYGTNDGGGNQSHAGTAFKLTPDGVLTTLYTFCSRTNRS